MVTSGLRIGTPAITTRGMTEPDMKVIAEAMDILAQKREVGIEEAKAMVKSCIQDRIGVLLFRRNECDTSRTGYIEDRKSVV